MKWKDRGVMYARLEISSFVRPALTRVRIFTRPIQTHLGCVDLAVSDHKHRRDPVIRNITWIRVYLTQR